MFWPNDPKIPTPPAFPKDRWIRFLICALLIVAVIFVAFTYVVTAALARDPDGRYTDSILKPWFDSLKDKKGNSCCKDFDGHPPEAVWKTEDGYQVQIEGQWVQVPSNAVLDTPNRYGGAVVWYWWEWEYPEQKRKIFHVRCFLAGALG